MDGELFRHVATVACLRKSQLRKPDRVPKPYDGRTFTLDGMMDLDITFNGVAMKTPIYIKATASEQLLLGEGVCRQLRIISYHPDVSDRKGKKWHPPPLPEQLESVKDKNASVPAVDQQDSQASVQPGRKNQPRGQVQDGNCTPGEEAPATKKNRHQRRSRRPWQGRKDTMHTTSGENRSHVTTQEGAHHPATGNTGAASATTTQGGPHHPNSGAIPDMTSEGAVLLHTVISTWARGKSCPCHYDKWKHPDGDQRTRSTAAALWKQPGCGGTSGATQTEPEVEVGEDVEAVVPMVRVHLLQTVRVPPYQSVFVKITTETELLDTPVVFEPSERMEQDRGIHAEDCLLEPSNDGTIKVPLTNPTATTRIIQAGEVLGQVTPASVIQAEGAETFVGRVLSASRDQQQGVAQEVLRKTKLRETIEELDLPPGEREAFQSFLMRCHHAFSLEDGERGETDLIRMEIDTGDAIQRNREHGGCHSPCDRSWHIGTGPIGSV